MQRRIGPVLGLFALGGLAGLVALACEDDPHRRTAPGQIVGHVAGGACESKPGELPPPDCDDSKQACSSTPSCAIDEARCGSTSTCLPLADNKGKDVVDLRFRRLNIASPAALAGPLIQNQIVNGGIDLAEKSCAERGKGLFSWLMRVDRAAGTVVTGGAPPSADPFGTGFCFANFTLGSTKIEPLVAKIAFEGDTFKMVEYADLNIPIFLSEQLSSAIILPISDARVEGVTLSADGDCIGSFNPGALDESCTEDRDLCPKWNTAGALGGFITLEQADAVKIRDLNNKSLCSFLSAGSGLVCDRDASGKIAFEGDYCSKDKAPGGCKDSVWLAATFAASAVKIFDGNGTVEGCSGGATGPVDAGADAEPGDGGDAGP